MQDRQCIEIPDYINIKRLRQYIKFPIKWGNIEITYKDIMEGIKNNIPEQKDMFASSWTDCKKGDEIDKNWHIGRILYFVNNPNKIEPLNLDNQCAFSNILPIPIITDGHHRYIAAVIRKDKFIPAYYSGLVSLLEYLTGESDIKPN